MGYQFAFVLDFIWGPFDQLSAKEHDLILAPRILTRDIDVEALPYVELVLPQRQLNQTRLPAKAQESWEVSFYIH